MISKIEYQKNRISKKQNDVPQGSLQKMEYQKNRISKKQNDIKWNIKEME